MTEAELRAARALVAREDIDPEETREWLEALEAVLEHDGPERVAHILERLLDTARNAGAPTPRVVSTPYINTIPPEEEAKVPFLPGSLEEVLMALEEDHDFLLRGDVFTPDLIDMWIRWKRANECDAIHIRPHPYEFYLYFDI